MWSPAAYAGRRGWQPPKGAMGRAGLPGHLLGVTRWGESSCRLLTFRFWRRNLVCVSPSPAKVKVICSLCFFSHQCDCDEGESLPEQTVGFEGQQGWRALCWILENTHRQHGGEEAPLTVASVAALPLMLALERRSLQAFWKRLSRGRRLLVWGSLGGCSVRY